MTDERKAMRCSSCKLNQYEPESGRCRKCKAEMAGAPPDLPLPALQIAAPVEVVAEPVATPTRTDVGARVYRLRTLRGLSQREMAERMGVPRTYISKVENEGCQPNYESLQRIADALEVSMVELLEVPRLPVLDHPLLGQMAKLLPYLTVPQMDSVLAEARRLARIHTAAGRSLPRRDQERAA